MKTKIFILFFALLWGNCVVAQTTYVPDDNFEQALIDLGYDDVLDGQVLTGNISAVASLDVSDKNINDLTGIEGFINLDVLDCNNNNLSSTNFTQNALLRTLMIANNNLSSIDLTHNQQLQSLLCDFNNLISIDLSQNQQLELLQIEWNNLSALDLSHNTLLTNLYVYHNELENLDLSNNSQITYLRCGRNLLSSLDVSNLTNLYRMSCENNNLTSINLSENIHLEHLVISFNQISQLILPPSESLKRFYLSGNHLPSLDLSAYPQITHIACDQNELAFLNLQNGENEILEFLYAISNPSLTCIQVDDAAYSTANWSDIDPQMYFSVNCGGSLTYVPDDNFEQALIDLGYDDVLDDYVVTSNISNVAHLEINDKGIHDLTGIESFTSLTHLYCNQNDITTIDVSQNTELIFFFCTQNALSTIDISHNVNLNSFGCDFNQISSINMGSTDIMSVSVGNNLLTGIDVSQNEKLKVLYCSNNLLTHLDLSHNNEFVGIDCSSNQLESLNMANGTNQSIGQFNASNNPNLSCIEVDNADWSTANWTSIDPTTSFSEDCGWGANDSDGDGIADDMDDYPADPDRAFGNYFPAEGFYTLAFEDLFPGKGDYDFNDVVVGYQFLTVCNATNGIVNITATFIVKAGGASMDNGFGFNLPDASNNLVSNLDELQVSGMDIQESYVNLQQNGFEDSQSKPTIIVFDNIFNILPHPGIGIGVNTELSAPFVPFDTISIHITTNEHRFTPSDFSLESWNPFIIVNKSRGLEVHLPDHGPTDLVDGSYFGIEDDNSNPGISRYYKTINNLPWAINIASEFKWAIEKRSISDAYTHFTEWAQSSGEAFPDWYQQKSGYRNEELIYAVP